jgi:hypothetical protein
MQKESMVSDVWVVMEGVGRWEWRWRRRPFVWEEALLTNLLDELPLLEISEEDDYWRWNREDDGRFSVRSAYLLVDEIFSPEVTIGAQELRVFKNIWKSPAPSKVVAFSWQLLYDRIPTRDNLLLRGVLPTQSDDLCVWCDDMRESSSHLFLHCKVAFLVWCEIVGT